MSHEPNLELLRKNRRDLLLAEAGAWLHNIGKLTPEFLEKFTGSNKGAFEHFKHDFVLGLTSEFALRILNFDQDDTKPLKKWRDAAARHREKFESVLSGSDLHAFCMTSLNRLPEPFSDRIYRVGDLVEFQRSDWYKNNLLGSLVGAESSHLTHLLQISHHSASGAEKGRVESQQVWPAVCLSSVFGHEARLAPERFGDARGALGASAQTPEFNRSAFIQVANTQLRKGIGETKRSLNDVSLWDLSSATAAFFKAAAAKCILDGKWPASQEAFSWRFLRVAVDGPGFYGRVARIPDLLIRKKLLEELLDEIQELLEDECPLANEVYRDENGSSFLAACLDGDDDKGSRLLAMFQELIIERLNKSENPLTPEVAIGLTISPPDEENARGLQFGNQFKQPIPPASADPARVREWWRKGTGDICPVCNLRPQGPGEAARRRRVCEPCEERREKRSARWANALGTTIWLEEVADRNGRVALITGRFALENWLDPSGHISSTLFLARGGDKKSPSFARLRRVWDTTSRFWEDIQEYLEKALRTAGPRLRVHGTFEGPRKPGVSCTYLLGHDEHRFSVVHTAPDVMLTAENIERAAILTGWEPKEGEGGKKEAAKFLKGWLDGRVFGVEEPTGYGSPNKASGAWRTERVEFDETLFAPLIPILAEPETFMILVPASEAMRTVNAIREKYETEMGKVRNRLPLHIGAVFARAATPIYAVLDAGRRMLKVKPNQEHWLVKEARRDGNVCRVTFANGVSWRIPVVMGDGATEDEWYPYFQPVCEGQPILAQDLKGGERVRVDPSLFDFEFLETAARRFEICYEGPRRRDGTMRRPYYLEQVGMIGGIWDLLSEGLDSAQRHMLAGSLVEKREAWRGDGDTVFEQFARDTLANANWKRGLKADERALLERAALDGTLADAMELHGKIVAPHGGGQFE
jgi:hypothetical protein